MDPLTVLGLASGVVQLIDFSSGVVRESYRLIKSSRDTPIASSKLSEIRITNTKLCANLLFTLDAQKPLSEDDALLETAIETCQSRLADLDATLEQLTLKKRAGRHQVSETGHQDCI